jgi:hypothetical protein
MPTLRDEAMAYLAGAAALRASIAGMSREQQIARPIPGKWSTLEVVCHIADFELIFADRMKQVIALDKPQLLAADEMLYVAALAYHERDIEEELGVVETTRRQMARILGTLPESASERIGIHSERGPRKLIELLTTATGHIVHHVPFILEKRKSIGLTI